MNSASSLARFRLSYFGSLGLSPGHWNGWHIQYEADGAGLASLTVAERQTAEAELLLALKAPLDPRPLLGLGYPGSEAALPTLHNLLALLGAHSWSTHALRAIAKINPSALDQTRLLHELAHGLSHENPLSDPLIDLLLGLQLYFPPVLLTVPVIEQIFCLLHHRKALVRSHALQTLRKIYLLPTAAQDTALDIERSQNDPIFQLIRVDGNPTSYHRAKRLLRIATQHAPGIPHGSFC